MTFVTYTCKNCETEIDVEVTIGEENNLPDKCPECNKPIPLRAHAEVEMSAIEQAERARDRFED